MDNFVFSIPTIAYFGKGQINILGETIKAHGGSKMLLAYGGGSVKKNGIYDSTFAMQVSKKRTLTSSQKRQSKEENWGF